LCTIIPHGITYSVLKNACNNLTRTKWIIYNNKKMPRSGGAPHSTCKKYVFFYVCLQMSNGRFFIRGIGLREKFTPTYFSSKLIHNLTRGQK
jgi:hypothetical protein